MSIHCFAKIISFTFLFYSCSCSLLVTIYCPRTWKRVSFSIFLLEPVKSFTVQVRCEYGVPITLSCLKTSTIVHYRYSFGLWFKLIQFDPNNCRIIYYCGHPFLFLNLQKVYMHFSRHSKMRTPNTYKHVNALIEMIS